MARVLAVDDEAHMTYVIATWLTENGHEVVRASDGVSALELLRAETFDVLITDVDMPRMDGLTLLSQRDAVDGLRGIILLTGRCDYKDLDPSCCGEKLRLLPKPFSPSGLAQLVNELLSQKYPANETNDLIAAR
jgi:two-component system chemotaxis response regulator CheY